jgi:hypothetical protein
MLARTGEAQCFSWVERDYLLYALALGMGGHPNHAALPFVFEKHLRVVPTWPTVLAWIVEPSFASLGAAPEHALHAGQKIEVHRPLSGPTTVMVRGAVVSVHTRARNAAHSS